MESIYRLVVRGTRVHLPLLLALTAGAFVAQRVTQTVLDSSYARSGYPVPYYEGQLSFSASKLEGWYATMEQHGTLGVYWQTQLLDFAFIAATAVFFTALLLCVARAIPSTHPARAVAITLVPLGVAAALLTSSRTSSPSSCWPTRRRSANRSRCSTPASRP